MRLLDSIKKGLAEVDFQRFLMVDAVKNALGETFRAMGLAIVDFEVAST
jgi:hypothetical protein